MIDIIRFQGTTFPFAYEKVYSTKDFQIVEGTSDSTILKAVSDKKTDILVNVEKYRGKDSFHYRNSGLTHSVCMLAKKNRVAIGFSFSDILQSKQRALLLGKMMQNIRLCRKYHLQMVFASFARNKHEMRDPKDMVAFARVLGMSPGEAKEALNFQRKEPRIKEIKN